MSGKRPVVRFAQRERYADSFSLRRALSLVMVRTVPKMLRSGQGRS
jgi:hypothetical protein